MAEGVDNTKTIEVDGEAKEEKKPRYDFWHDHKFFELEKTDSRLENIEKSLKDSHLNFYILRCSIDGIADLCYDENCKKLLQSLRDMIGAECDLLSDRIGNLSEYYDFMKRAYKQEEAARKAEGERMP